jgi:site-specific DNA-adenine methylase
MNQKAFPSYFGGKAGAGTYQSIINFIPPHKYFISPFLGNGGVEMSIRPGSIALLNDIDPVVVERWLPLLKSGYSISNLDYKDFLNSCHSYLTDAVVYCDPPYLLSSRKSQKLVYNFEWIESDHIKFLQFVCSYEARIAISCYDNYLYCEYLKGWNKITYKSMTRSGIATETLYMNYPAPEQLHDYSYIGKNFTDRQRIKRKRERYLNAIASLPVHERYALLEALANVYGGHNLKPVTND